MPPDNPFPAELGRRMTAAAGDTREGWFLFQRIFIAIQRCNLLLALLSPHLSLLVTRDQYFLLDFYPPGNEVPGFNF